MRYQSIECPECGSFPDEPCNHPATGGDIDRIHPKRVKALTAYEPRHLHPCPVCSAEPGELCRTVGNDLVPTPHARRPTGD